jgi:O-Antigen ligase
MLGIAHYAQSRLLSLIGQVRYQLLERHFIYTIRIGLIASTILLTLITAYLLNKRGMMALGIVGGLAGVLVLLFIYRYTGPAVLLLILVTTIAEVPLPDNITVTLLFILILTFIWLVKLLLVQRSFSSLRPMSLNYLVPLWAVAVIISFIWSSFYVDSQVRFLQDLKLLPRIVTALVMILSPVAMLLFANFLRSIDEIKKIIWYYLAFGAFLLFAAFLHIRLTPNFNDGGQIGDWVCIFALGQVLFNHKLSRWLRFVLLLLVAGWAFKLFGLQSSWISGWLPTLVGCGIVVFLRSRIAFVAVVAVMLGYGAINIERFDNLLTEEQTVSGDTRLGAAERVFQITKDHFLFGTGPAGYKYYMTIYIGGTYQLSHNTYVDMLAETGVFGFTIYLLIWVGIGWMVLKTFQSIPKRGFEGGLVVSLAAIYPTSLLLMMLGDWIIPFPYTQTLAGIRYTILPWLWMGMAVALRAVAPQTPDEPAVQSVS